MGSVGTGHQDQGGGGGPSGGFDWETSPPCPMQEQLVVGMTWRSGCKVVVMLVAIGVVLVVVPPECCSS